MDEEETTEPPTSHKSVEDQQSAEDVTEDAAKQPTEKVTQPAEERTTPTEEMAQKPAEEVTQSTVEGTQQPAEEMTQPTEEVTQPTEEVTQPTEEVTQPAEEVTQPAKEVIQPAEEVTQKPAEEITQSTEEGIQQLAEQVTQPAEEVTQPAEEVTQLAEEVTQSTEEGTQQLADEVTQPTVEVTQQPAEKVTQPTEEVTQPVDKVTQPAEEVTQPAEKVTQPAEKVTQPAEEIKQPGEEMTEQPTEDVIQPAEKATLPAEEMTQAAEEGTQPAEKVTQPAEEVTRAAEEGTQPAEKVTQPAEEVTRAAEEGTQPVEEVTQPAEEVTTEEGTQPTVEVTQPAEGVMQQATEDVTQPPEQMAQSAKEVTQQAMETQQVTEGVAEEEEGIPEDFYYDYSVYVSRPFIEGMPDDVLSLHSSLGYECQRRSNLVVMDTNTIMFIAGNIVQMVNLLSWQHCYLRSLSGGGIGALTVHPSHQYFAVGEKGHFPHICIYSYPELKLYRLLREGTEQAYSDLDFSSTASDGKLLASVGSSPDYMLTVWDWKQEKIVLRCKAFSQEIYRVTFSPDNEGQLTTSGTGHIRFWKMASTFTGLKLQGELGKFGRTELSDISAYVELPDGKVLSGSEWGNMLLWDGGFIKVEIAKKGKKSCHNGNIEAIYLDEGELISAGVDGFVRVWDFETIDNADISEDSTVFEMEPLTEIKVGSDVSLKSLTRSADINNPHLWYAQDSNGAVWKIDIVVSHTRKPPERLVTYHSGEITGLDTSPSKHWVASISANGSVRVHNCETSELVCHSKFAGGGASLLWATNAVDPSGHTLITGYVDGVLRVLVLQQLDHSSHDHRKTMSLSPARSNLTMSSANLTLAHVCKPHKSRLTCLAVDNQGLLLATGGADGTVFFLSIKDNYEPVGFITTPSPVTVLQWTTTTELEKLKLLVCCEDGAMLEVIAPQKDIYDTSNTYLLEPLKFTCRHFSSVKDKIKRAKEEAARNAERERKKKEREAKLKKKKEKEGEDAVLSDEEEEVEEPPLEEEKRPPPGPSPILTGFYHYPQPDNTFWLTLGGYDTGYIYQCTMDGATDDGALHEPDVAVPLPPQGGEDRSLTAVYISHKGQHLLTGMDNGVIRIHPLTAGSTDEYYISESLQDSHWSISVHDNDIGRVTKLASTFDDQYVISAGADGNLFVFKFNSQLEAPSLPSVVSDKVTSPPDNVLDIEDPNAYSIEDAKQKAEHDRKMKLAEEKKQKVRKEVIGLRRQFYQVLLRNKELPAHLQLSTKDFIMDPEMEEKLAQQTREKVELVHKEMSWEKQKNFIAMDKLNKKYKAVLECERIVVWGMEKCNDYVSSYRAPAPSSEFLNLIQQPSGVLEFPPSTATTAAGISVPGTSNISDVGSPSAQLPTQSTGIQKKGSTKALSKAEAKRLRKEQRAKQWEMLMKRKPDDKFEDPHDVELLRIARDNIGDYKLKSSKDYVVPEDQQVTTERKRHELLLLRNKLFEYRRNYNKKLIALRDRKIQDINRIEQLLSKVKELQKHLPADKRLSIPAVPRLRPEEVPERRTEYTNETLLQFKEEMIAKQEAEQKAQAGSDEFGGFGGFGGGATEEDEIKNETDSVSKEQQPSTATTSISSVGIPPADAHVSKLEAQLQQEQLLNTEYEQLQCLREVKLITDNFNSDLLHLRHYKYHQDVILKTAELRHITLFEELELLKEFEKRETTFISRYQNKKTERKELDRKINELQRQVQRKEREVVHLTEEEKSLHNSFSEAVGEGNKFRDFLIVRVFRKKIKRAKKKPQEQEGAEDDGSSSEEESESELSSSDDESDSAEGGDKMDDSVCPQACDQDLFDLACEMREKRMDIEEVIAEEKKSLEILKREVEGLKKKMKVMDSGVKSALNDLQGFQLEKLQKLNELDQVVVMKLHQILHYGPDGAPPSSLGACLVFPAPVWSRLQARIGELQHEKQDERKHYKELKLRHVKLVREKKEMMASVATLEEKCREMMMLKFGRVVNLEQLENVTVNKLAEELQRKIKQQEKSANKELSDLKKVVEHAREELMSITRQNTRRLNMMTELLNTRKELDVKLNHRQKKMEVSLQGEEEEEAMEQQRLRHLVGLQSQEIMALKDEIRTLSHKGGHILPPPHAPMAAPEPTHNNLL